MKLCDIMRARLTEAFAPETLEIIDESEKHRGHAGWNAGGETHFHISMQTSAFAGMSRLERHRAVHAALGTDLTARIHALSLQLTG